MHPYTLFIETLLLENKLYDVSCLLLSLLALVCALVRPTIPTYSCNFLVAFYTCYNQSSHMRDIYIDSSNCYTFHQEWIKKST